MKDVLREGLLQKGAERFGADDDSDEGEDQAIIQTKL